MFVTVTYDIGDDRRRRKIARLMEDYGQRVQWSVFDCDLDEANLAHLRRLLTLLLDPEEDSVRIYRMCARCRGSVEVVGAGSVLQTEDVVII